MSERSVGARRTAAHPDARPSDGVPRRLVPPKPARAGGAWLPWTVAGLGIVWLIAKLWSAYEQIHANAGDSVAVATAALAIPAVVQATALGGLGGGLRSAWPRSLAGTANRTPPSRGSGVLPPRPAAS